MDDHQYVLSRMVDWEDGQLDERHVLEFFAAAIRSGDAWTLQGFYGRQAAKFINEGVISEEGRIDWIRATTTYGRR